MQSLILLRYVFEIWGFQAMETEQIFINISEEPAD
jgi:hypothetical protein